MHLNTYKWGGILRKFQEMKLKDFLATICFSGLDWKYSKDTDLQLFQILKTKFPRNQTLKLRRGMFIMLLIFLQDCSIWLNYWPPINLNYLQPMSEVC